MSDPRYDIYFRGGIQPGTELSAVKANMATLFNVNDARIDTMFSGKACVLKKDLDKAKALQYQQAIEKTGAKVFLKEKPLATQAETPPPSTPAPAPSDPEGSPWDLFPTGSDLLKAEERKPDVSVDIDTSNIQLSSPFAEVNTDAPPPPPAPNIDHLSMAEVGADILAEKAADTPPPALDLSDMDVAPLGANMSTDDEG